MAIQLNAVVSFGVVSAGRVPGFVCCEGGVYLRAVRGTVRLFCGWIWELLGARILLTIARLFVEPLILVADEAVCGKGILIDRQLLRRHGRHGSVSVRTRGKTMREFQCCVTWLLDLYRNAVKSLHHFRAVSILYK